MGGFTVKIDGLAALEARMKSLGGEQALRIGRRALCAGGRIFQREVEDRAPERPNLPSGTALPPGALRRDVIVTGVKGANGLTQAQVRPGKLTGHAAHMVEYGHEMVVHGVHKGQVPAHPYARPAFEAGGSEALDAVRQSMVDDMRLYVRASVPDNAGPEEKS